MWVICLQTPRYWAALRRGRTACVQRSQCLWLLYFEATFWESALCHPYMCIWIIVCVCVCVKVFPPLLRIPPRFSKRLSEHASGTQWLNRNFAAWKPCKFTFQLVLRFTDSRLDLFVLWFIIHWHIWLCSSNCSMQHQRLHLMEHKWINKSWWLGHLNVWHLLMRQLREQRTNTQPAQHRLIPAPHNNTNYPFSLSLSPSHTPSHLLCRKTLTLQMNIYV